ncbi:MAG: hypothetical protein ACI4TZ_01115 [Christensenellales bacterium]
MKNYNVNDLYLAKISVILGTGRDSENNSVVHCQNSHVAVVKKGETNLYSKKQVYVDALTNEKYYPLLEDGIRGALVYDDVIVPLKYLVKNKETISQRGITKLLKEVKELNVDFLFDLFDETKEVSKMFKTFDNPSKELIFDFCDKDESRFTM